MNIYKQVNIFIVDDNKIFSLVLKAYIETTFKNMFTRIYSFETGEKCMESFFQVLPELVILDYDLNSTSANAANGLQFLEKIKKINPGSSVIMLTSNDNIETVLESFHHGASDYVVKTESPFKKINKSISKIFSSYAKQAAELVISNNELSFQNEEKEKRAAEFIVVNNQKSEVERTKLIVEEKNKDITDSINYAKRIQQAKLPKKENIFASLPQSFILFKPKDIVSGDFYFFNSNDQSVFIAAADCTGHGVPGALMSMIGSEKLTEAVSQSADTSEILKYLNKGIKKSLNQSDSIDSTRDGMDIAICAVDTENCIVKYAGANRPLWIIGKGEKVLFEIKATKKAIGGLTEDNQHFDTHELKLKQGDTFYISTDGYADQFGGKEGKKLMTKNLKKILLDIQDKSMQEQKIYLDNFVENWKTGIEQLDDILVIGVRL